MKHELRLSHCRTADEVFRVLEDCYGDMSQIADDIVLELQDLPAVHNNQPREALQLIQAVERALLDLIDLGCEDAIKKQLVIRSLESKLPDSMKERWLLYRCDATSNVNPRNRFDKLWQFLRDQKTVLVLDRTLPEWVNRAPVRNQRKDQETESRRGTRLPRPRQARREENLREILAVCVAKRGILDAYTAVRHLERPTHQSAGLKSKRQRPAPNA